MTAAPSAEERAKMILMDVPCGPGREDRIEKAIAEAILEAEERGYQRGINENATPLVHKAFIEGAAQMRERASKFVLHLPTHPEKFSAQAASIIANGIRTIPLAANDEEGKV